MSGLAEPDRPMRARAGTLACVTDVKQIEALIPVTRAFADDARAYREAGARAWLKWADARAGRTAERNADRADAAGIAVRWIPED